MSRTDTFRPTPAITPLVGLAMLGVAGVGAWVGISQQAETVILLIFVMVAGVAFRLISGRMKALEASLGQEHVEAALARDEVRLERRFLDTVLESCPDAMMLFDRRGGVMLANEAARRLARSASFPVHIEDVIGAFALAAPGSDAPLEVQRLGFAEACRGVSNLGVDVVARRGDDASGSTSAPLVLSTRPLGDPVSPRGVVLVLREIPQARALEAAVVRAEAERQALRAELAEQQTLRDANEALHSSASAEEASRVIAGAMDRLFPRRSGAVFLLNAQRTVVEARTTWGTVGIVDGVFGPDDCWALRRGKPHFVDDVVNGLVCRHVHGERCTSTLCVPLVVQSELLGVLHLASLDGSPHLTERERELGVLAAEQTALGLANLRLREKLRGEAVRDPLTGLFNRRAMEETLERELRRAIRKSRPLSLMFVDLDHFKRLNDDHGHAAGDAALAAVGALLGRFFRVDDLVCRYGGEEFAVMLAESNSENARLRAEALRQAIAQLRVEDRGQPIPSITASIGVASCPDHALTIDNLIRAADAACYQAKRSGRDRVRVAPSMSRPSQEPVTGDLPIEDSGAKVVTMAGIRLVHR